MKKEIFSALIITLLVLSGEVSSKEYGGGRIRIGNGGGGYDSFTLGGNGGEVYDKDNPNPLASFLEPKIDKISRIKRKSLKENLDYIYSRVVPKYEQSAWMQDRNKITEYGTYGSYSWASENDRDHVLEITYEEISFKNYKNVKELIDSYKKELQENCKYMCSVNVLKQTNSSVVFEIERFERGVSDTLKKNTQTKSIEKWLINNGWVLNLSYSLSSKGDKEKNDLWGQLKNTWEKRFEHISFDSEEIKN